MLRKFIASRKLRVIIIITAMILVSCHFTQQTLPSDAGSGCATGPQSLTDAEVNTWFESGTASLNGAVNPANSVIFPDVPNCSFYKWSEQMFLWLTSPAPPRYGSNGLVMNTSAFYDVSLPDATGQRTFLPHSPGLIRAFNLRTAQKGALDLPIILERGTLRMLEILPAIISSTGNQVVMDGNGQEVEIGRMTLNANRLLILFDKNGKEIIKPRAVIQLAKDSAASILTSKLRKIENFDRTTLVQKFLLDKRVFFLDLFGNFHETEQGQADGGVLMAQNGSLVYYSLSVNNVYALFRTMQGAVVPANTKFPTTQATLDNISAFATANNKSPVIDSVALAIEIKCSWVKAEGLTDADKFIKMKAIVPTYDKSNPNEWVPNGTETIELAMVGMHVVGSTKGHPELLWSTFEQVSNDPVAAYTYKTTGGTNSTIPQNTAGVWNFCTSGSSGPFNLPHMLMGGSSGDHIVAVSGQTISASDIRREMPWGLNGSSAVGNAEVISINNKVRSILDPNDVRINYIQTGTTWTKFGSNPDIISNQVGTNILANTTMETFSQGNNCFSCHNTNTTVVSHVFDNTKPLF